MSPGMLEGSWRWLWFTIGFAIVYVPAAQLSMALAIPPGNVTPVYPAAALAWAALLFLGPKALPAVWLGGFLGNFLSFVEAGNVLTSVLVGMAIGTGEALAGLVGCYFLTRIVGHAHPFDSMNGTLAFLAISFAWFVSPTVGITSLAFGHFVPWEGYAYAWTTWWLGDSIGLLVAMPVLLMFLPSTRPALEPVPLEVAALTGGSVVIGAVVFTTEYPVTFLVLPLVMWASFRYQFEGAALANVVIAGIAVASGIYDQGPFARFALNERLLLLQAFVGLSCTSSLFIAALVVQRGQSLAALFQTERMASIGQMATTIAHELNQPLQIIAMQAEIGRTRLGREDVSTLDTRLETIEAQVTRATAITTHLRRLGRDSDASERQGHDVREIIDSALTLTRIRCQRENVTLRVDVDKEPTTLHCDRVLIEQVLSNLVDNAMDAISLVETKEIRVRTRTDPPFLEILVEDSGEGIASPDRVFEPFYTTKELGRGTGIGLALCRSIVEEHHGTIEAGARPGGGARMRLTLPLGR